MGIHGLLRDIGPGTRISLAKFSSSHYTTHSRPLRLAIDISIWLFQIQSGKGGSNPALRTFYYRLLRLLSLNIHPLFVFDGRNKPLFKRNKKVGGPGVRVASVPEFLAKQLLKQFGFPWHVAPGEAEAECALLQQEGIVDAVLSEDVDTLMFGSGVTLRNWTSENTTKSPTHVDVYRAEETKERSGLDREGMVLVALMSGGDYIPEGIPGVGAKVACDAARAGFGSELCKLSRRDADGLRRWKERLQHQMRTNEAKYFSRKNTNFTIPEDFPNFEVLGYYTHPCVSTPERLARLRAEVKWDQEIDYPALRSFTSDAFDWRCIGGAKKFIKNLAPAILIRELRLRGTDTVVQTPEAQEEIEKNLVQAIHGKRNHSTTDGELEYRISFTPSTLVPIDLSIEEEDDQFIPAGGIAASEAGGSDAESDFLSLPPSSTADSEAPSSPSKKRTIRPYDPAQPEKLWLLKPFLQIGCPLLVEEYEASTSDPREFLKARRKAKAAARGEKGEGNIHAPKKGAKKKKDVSQQQEGGMMAYTRVTKPASSGSASSAAVRALKELSPAVNSRLNLQDQGRHDEDFAGMTAFKLPSTQLPPALLRNQGLPRPASQPIEVLDLATDTTTSLYRTQRPVHPARPFAAFAGPASQPTKPTTQEVQKTPKRNKKRPSPSLSSPSPAASQKPITSYYSPSPRTPKALPTDGIISLLSSSPARAEESAPRRPQTPTPPNTRFNFVRSISADFSPGKLPDTVTKRRRKEPLKRWQTAPAAPVEDFGKAEDWGEDMGGGFMLDAADQVCEGGDVDGLDEGLLEGEHDGLPSPGLLFGGDDDTTAIDVAEEEKPRASRTVMPIRSSSPVPTGQDTDDKVDWWLKSAIAGDAFNAAEPAATLSSHVLCRPPRQEQHESALPPPTITQTTRKKPVLTTSPKSQPQPQPLRTSPRLQQKQKKKRILLRASLEGAWKEVPYDAEQVDLSGDGSGWKKSKGRAKIVGFEGGWRKSGVEVLDLTGA